MADEPTRRDPDEQIHVREDRPEFEQEILVESDEAVVGKGFQVCIKLSEKQQRILSELSGTAVTELRINVDELADLASVIAN